MEDKVLIIEDNQKMARLMEIAISKEGLSVIKVFTGKEGITALEERGDRDRGDHP